ncbi:hypothetical protein EHT87_31130, partial [Larkinella knui]
MTITNGSGCTAVNTTPVVVGTCPSVPCSLTGTVASSQTVCSGSAVTIQLTASGGTSYQWKGPNGYSSTQQNPTLTNATAINSGTYSVTITNGSGCTAVNTTPVVVGTCPSVPCSLTGTVASSQTVCSGSVVSIQLSASGGTSYQWQGPNNFTSSLASPLISTATAINSGTYSVTITNGSGCTAVNTTPVVVGTCPSVPCSLTGTVASSQTVCVGSVVSIQLSASGGTSYQWQGPNGFTSLMQNPTLTNATAINSGTYSVTITNGSGCTAVNTTPVVVGTCPSVPCSLTGTVASSQTVCVGSVVSIQLSASGGTSYQWKGPNGFTSLMQNPTLSTATAINSGTYSVTITNGSGCTAVNTTPVVVGTCPSVPCSLTGTVASSQTVCSGSAVTIQLTASGGTSYQWKGPNGFTSLMQNPTLSTATAINSGTYSVTITNGSGCTAVNTTPVVVGTCPSVPCSLTGTV